MGFDQELESLFTKLSISTTGTLPAKAHDFVSMLFQNTPGVEVPPVSWFSKFIPNSDRHGITYDALVRLEERCQSYSPGSPKDMWDTVPLKVLIRWCLQAGCQAYKESTTHRDWCTWFDCEVCVREQGLEKDSMQCREYLEWCERNEDELRNAPQLQGPLPRIPRRVLGELRGRLK
ncbi:hypothetical protein NMY22_g2526 [Coprinellus aureogranulatus]|nr:hypothetical protein NMY22_g2526 [Coprinellus aureogranulatus]